MKNLVVYTAMFTESQDYLFGNIPDYNHNKDGVDYICFTNNKNLKSNFWDIKYVGKLESDARREARKYKLLPHRYLPEYRDWIWTDSNIYIKYCPESLVNYYLKEYDIAVHKHCDRNCLYEESKVIIESRRDNEDIVSSQIQKYYNDGCPINNGLYETGILMRKNNNFVIKFNETWYKELKNGSKRDQISFPYVYWKLKNEIKINVIQMTFANHNTKIVKKKTPYFKIVGKKWKKIY